MHESAAASVWLRIGHVTSRFFAGDNALREVDRLTGKIATA
jgi:hypothetical protein